MNKLILNQLELDHLLKKMASDRSALTSSLSQQLERSRETRAKVSSAVKKSGGPLLFGLGATLVASLARKRPGKSKKSVSP